MKIIQPSVVIENQDWSELLRKIETKIGRASCRERV